MGRSPGVLEGNFYLEIYEKKNKIVNSIRNIYYESGSNNSIFKYIVQGAWLIILSIQPLTIFIKRKNMDNSMRVVLLSLIGLFILNLFLKLEQGIYIPTFQYLFIVSGMIGLNEFLNRMENDNYAECVYICNQLVMLINISR